MGGYYPSRHCRWYPSMPCSRSHGGVLSQHALQVVSQHALQQVSRGRGLLLWGCLVRGGVCSWGVPGPGGAWSRRSAPGGVWWRPPRDGYCCGGTHPTRMHSCLEEEFTKNLDCYKLSLLTIFISFSRLLNSSMIILYLQQ